MDLITRTDLLRANNKGRINLHRQVGVQNLELITIQDERVCPICGPLDGKVFDTGRFPQQPAHPNCRCTSVVAWPLVICGGELGAKAAADARTKADFIKLLDQAEPGFDHTNLTGAALKAKLKEHKIGLLRTKEELVKLLAEKQTALKQAQQLAEQLKKVPAAGGLQDLTVVELKEMAKTKGISLNMTKQDVIDLLDELEPGVDHSGLKGKALIAAKTPHRPPQEQAAAHQVTAEGRWRGTGREGQALKVVPGTVLSQIHLDLAKGCTTSNS
jgi:uncharacterized protein YunC (DUF1805 family)